MCLFPYSNYPLYPHPALVQMLEQCGQYFFPPPLSTPKRATIPKAPLKPTVKSLCSQLSVISLFSIWGCLGFYFFPITSPMFLFSSFFFVLFVSLGQNRNDRQDLISSCLLTMQASYEFACFFLPLPSFSNHFLDFKSLHHPCFRLKLPQLTVFI